MENIVVYPGRNRKLVAVLATDGVGIWFRDSADFSKSRLLFKTTNRVGTLSSHSLEHLSEDPTRMPIYEGDTVTIQF